MSESFAGFEGMAGTAGRRRAIGPSVNAAPTAALAPRNSRRVSDAVMRFPRFQAA